MIQRNQFKRSVLALAIAVATSSVVHAQSTTTGTIYGSAEAAGATIVIENVNTGLVRRISVGENGRYSASALPPGEYKVSLERDGKVVAVREKVAVQIGGGNEISFGAGKDASALETIVVSGDGSNFSPIDISQTDTRVVLTAEDLQKIPVARDITSVALMTPGVVAADSRYGNTASFGGSAASENAIYINGYAVTNPLTNLGSTTLPFDAINQYQSIIGGYGAEFGRSTGGVINILTKSGTNEWQFGAQTSYSPEDARAMQRSRYYAFNGKPTDGLLLQNLAARTLDKVTYGAYASGPIVQDHLFFYLTGEVSDQEVHTVNTRTASAATSYRVLNYDQPRWLGKLDWNITDSHLLEFTAVRDVTEREDQYYQYSYTGIDALTPGTTVNGGYQYEDGGNLYIGKYTGYLTDSLTLTAMYGEQDQIHFAAPMGYDATQVYVVDNRGTANPVSGRQPYLNLSDPNAQDATENGRLDLEWMLGDHDIRFGYDRQQSVSTAGTAMSGPGYAWFYEHTDNPNEQIPSSGGAAGPGGNGDYVVKYIFANGGTFKVTQEAQYIEDRWQVSDNWLLSMGLRNEQFSNFNADGIVYASQRHQLAPRFGASWDVHGDSSLKLFANLGRYHLAMPNNVALRGAAGSTYTREFFAFTGIDPNTGVPTGLTALGDGPYSANNEYGQAPDPATVAAASLKSHFQDEFIIGMEKQLNDGLAFGARFVYRDLKSAIDDMCDGRAGYAWAIENGLGADVAQSFSDQLQHCRLFNPGDDNTFTLDDGTGHLVSVPLTAAELGFPKLKRRYMGIDTFLEHAFDGTFYYRLDYTFSKNYGNAEGQLNSDVGQQDVSQTLVWDHPELMEFSNGYLPNDRRHFLKAHGYWQMSDEWRMSGRLSVASGRPRSCSGYYGGEGSDEFFELYDYGPYYHYCGSEVSPRGAAGRLPWSKTVDLGITYSPSFTDQKLQLTLDVFNILNSQPMQNIEDRQESGGFNTRRPDYNTPISFQDPRSIRLTARYDW